MAEPAEVLNRKIAAGDEVAKECSAVEEAIAALRMSYEQYFLGIDRRPPTVEHNDLKKKLQQLKGRYVRQTALKFRVQSIQAKFVTYERLWSRTLQEIEAGTYRRDLYKAKLHQKEQKEKAPEQEAPPQPPAPQQAQAQPAAKGAPGAPPPAKPGAPAAPGAPARPAAQAPAPARSPAAPAAAAAASGAGGGLAQALSDQKLRAVYDAYVTAKRRCQEDVSKLSYEQVAANLRKQVPELVKKSGAQGVEFKIVIKDGKAILRALPK